ncbi:alpha/beta hydrolase [Burkholderia sp. Cy-647]|nr:alpha/beta hydrolase [Burkholderia sp. Tr-860]NIF62256.1 alpha/beta hydrolase [Burkholderia sp. Cy-647]NIF94472.1 alpha/beta hydrolase [Burkholderia sp. Ax-1720]
MISNSSHPAQGAIDHGFQKVNGATLHIASTGTGRPLMLLHGWPEFWLTWEPVMTRLASRFRLIVPDLRGSGDSDKPAGDFGANDQARDLLALLDALDCRRVGLVGHDIGGAVMQALARTAPERFAGLFFFDFVHPGIGPRFGTPERLRNIWYMAFHETDLAPALIGASPETIERYISYFLRHWSYRREAFDAVLDRFVENFQKPGNVAGGLAHYRASAASRLAMLNGAAPLPPPIMLPTCVRWAEHDPMFDYAWTDRLHETFPDLDLALFPGVGHFPHREDPERAAAEIAAFFEGLAW